MKDKVIAIDGPSGSGKSTITVELAKKLGFTYLDTGAMFRALGVLLSENNFEVENPSGNDLQEITSFLEELKFEYAPSESILIRINDRDFTQKIREHQVSKLASIVSKIIPVRDYLKEAQRSIAKKRNSILEGRDIGTVIFPDAALKIYLTATSEVRAQRRLKELEERGEKDLDLAQIKADIEKRDYEDMNRDIAPLKKADDAIEINSDNRQISDIVNEIAELASKRKEF